MAQCAPARHLFVRLSGELPQANNACPEYTLASNTGVYVVLAKHPGQLMPLAEGIPFRLQKNECIVLLDGGKEESHFWIKEAEPGGNY